MGSMIFGLIFMSLGAAGVLSAVQARGDNAVIFLVIGIIIELGGILFFLSGAKQYFLQEIIDELKTMNGKEIPKSTDGWSFGPDKKTSKKAG